MGIIYRPHGGNVYKSIKEVKYFNTFENLQEYIADNMKDYIKLKPQEIVAYRNPSYDERIGWLDSDYLCIDSFDKIEDKEGYRSYFGGESNSPQCIGYFATQWNRDQPNGIKKNTPISVQISEV